MTWQPPTAQSAAEHSRPRSALSWLVQGFLAAPPLLEYVVRRLESRPRAALRLGSALGDCRPATDALSPAALLEVLAP